MVNSEYSNEYQILKDAIQYNEQIVFNDNVLTLDHSKIKRIYHKINHNLLRACLYTNLGDFLGSINKKEQLESYQRAFDAIRIENETSMLYSLFDKITPLMFDLALYEGFISLTNSFIYELKLKKLPIPPSMLFGLSIAYTNNAQILDALECIEQYLEHDYDKINYPKGLLMKANLYSRLNRFDIAKDVYLQSSALFLERGDYDNHCLTLSNIIDLLISQGESIESALLTESINYSIDYYIKDIKQKISKNEIHHIDLAKIYTNIAKGYTFKEDYEVAMSHFETAFQIDFNEQQITHYFRVIKISIPCFAKMGKLDYLYEKYVKYDNLPNLAWTPELKNAYEEVLLKIGNELVNDNQHILQEIFKSLIIIKDYE